jgi:hypothetical protein
MSLENVLESHSWKGALKVFFAEATEHKDVCMMRLLIDELQGVADVIRALEACLEAEPSTH